VHVRRSDRLFDIIQALRTAPGPVTAASLADTLEVTVRTIYRDIATLQGRRVPIEGAAGIGYVLRRGYDLPPLAFTDDELEAIAVGSDLLRRTGDAGLQQAARNVLSKVMSVMPANGPPRRSGMLFVSDFGVARSPAVDLALVRTAIRNQQKLKLSYRDETGKRSRRTIWPLAVAYYVKATIIAGWCEVRRDYRHFRTDRIASLALTEERFDDPDGKLMAGWRDLPKFGPAPASAPIGR
jgi:predicted DNA-binding transcriptional regulator YafY